MANRPDNRTRPETREDRLRAALRENLQRRKAQARARAEQIATTDRDDNDAGTTGGDES